VTPTTFGEAYGILLHKMQKAYPDAQIFAMTLLPENLYAVDKTAWEQHNAYIRAAAEYYEVPVVDLATNCAITWENYSTYMMDKIHPTTAGMELISDCVESELVAYYQETLPHVHTPVVDPAVEATCSETGLTEGSHCETCGEVLVAQVEIPAIGHSHSRYGYNNTNHWSICDCGEVVSGTTDPHEYTNGKCVCDVVCVTVVVVGDVPHTVNGQTVTVDDPMPCRLGYWDKELGKYIRMTAVANEDGTYSFTAPDDAAEVLLVAMGNANEDERVTVSDVAALNAHILGKKNLTGEAMFAADVNGDGMLDENDITVLFNALLGKGSLVWEVV